MVTCLAAFRQPEHVHGWSVGLLLLRDRLTGMLQALHDFCGAFAVYT
jgi:hypothetical protein